MIGSYSVLMSVYYKEKPEYLRASMRSIFEQTIPTDDYVMVCDGALTEELDAVIDEMREQNGDVLRITRLPENKGLGNALNEGLKRCRHELVARMDSDDISVPDRCERQLKEFERNPELSILSGTILEFRDTPENVVGIRSLPEKDDAIKRFSRKRCPFNHPAVMFKKDAVEAAGGYTGTYPLFEDYDLWIRMLRNGSVGANLCEPLLFMRVSDSTYSRRGGGAYAQSMIGFRKWMLDIGYINRREYVLSTVPHAVICILPNAMRKKIYGKLHIKAELSEAQLKLKNTQVISRGGGNSEKR